jgi:hypothetical protein
MNRREILNRLKIMLALESDDEKETKEELKSLATLVDGTEVFVMEGDIAPGSILNVVTEGEEQLLAPEGIHETSDGLIITVGEGGVIVSVEPKAVEEEMETVEVEVEPETADATEELLSGMAELLKPFIEEVKELNEEFKKIKQRFEAIADEPATTKIKTRMSASKEDADAVEKRIEILKRIRKTNK